MQSVNGAQSLNKTLPSFSLAVFICASVVSSGYPPFSLIVIVPFTSIYASL